MTGNNDHPIFARMAQRYLALWVPGLLLVACTVAGPAGKPAVLENDYLKFVIDSTTSINIFRKTPDGELSIIRPGNTPHYLIVNNQKVNRFVVDNAQTRYADIHTRYGAGRRLSVVAKASGPLQSVIEKRLQIDLYEDFPEAVVINTTYRNISSTAGLVINTEVGNAFNLSSTLTDSANKLHDFYILQGASYKERPDWVLPVTDTFSYQNYQGQQLAIGETGGGLPALDVWNKETGLLIGSLRDKPTLISLPARVIADSSLAISIAYDRDGPAFTDTYEALPVAVAVHGGDFYNGLKVYANLMARNGLEMPQPPPDAYEPIWCSWGFGPDFSQEQIFAMIPVIKDFGFKVATLDAGWFYYNGDYAPRDDTFPLGDKGMKNFVNRFHDNGLKIKIWITTHIAGEKLAAEHPEWLLINREGATEGDKFMGKQYTPYLCPAVKGVQDYYRQMAKKFIGEWGFDGFKIDQELINSVGKCYAAGHRHKYPEESVEALPEIYKILYEETIALKPGAVVEVCPCGMFPSFYKMPYYNQPVSSDFNTTWQIRHRGKVIKALMGPAAAFYGDHIERRYTPENFPAMIGVGGIPGTMFVSKEEDNAAFLRQKYPGYLSPERKKLFTKWLRVYHENTLSKGEYLNLYDIAYDVPETHTILVNDTLYYAFYATEWQGEVEFRGLEDRLYDIIDYEHEVKLGSIRGNQTLPLVFSRHLLVKAVPRNN